MKDRACEKEEPTSSHSGTEARENPCKDSDPALIKGRGHTNADSRFEPFETGGRYLMNKLLLATLGGVIATAATGADAQVTYTFNMNNQGWTTGDVSGAVPDAFTHPASWATGQLTAIDESSETGVYAPGGLLGNQAAAYGSFISFDVSDAFNDGVPYPALILYGANGLAAAVRAGPPSTDNGSLTPYEFNLDENTFDQFFGGNALGGPISQSDFQSILANLSGVAFRTEYKTGGDDSRFDNAVFSRFVDHNATTPGAVPEPATWGMMLAGFGAMGYAMRRRAKVRAKISFA